MSIEYYALLYTLTVFTLEIAPELCLLISDRMTKNAVYFFNIIVNHAN